MFINTLVDFVIVAIATFLVVRMVNRLKWQQDATPAAPSTRECPFCLTAIPLAATRCPHCTSHLDGAPTTSTP
jgi:large conductance mechanosensitive channel